MFSYNYTFGLLIRRFYTGKYLDDFFCRERTPHLAPSGLGEYKLPEGLGEAKFQFRLQANSFR
jgi:hypothetical protein